MSRSGSHALGRRGETLTAWIYRLQGYRILGRNVVERGVEIDLIARRGRSIAFIEVKTRSSELGGEPWEAVSDRQKERLFLAAEQFVRRTGGTGIVTRFDVVAILWERLVPSVKIYRNAYLAMSDADRPWKRRIIANR